MGDTSETTKVLLPELFLGVVALQMPRKFIICAKWALFPGIVTYVWSSRAVFFFFFFFLWEELILRNLHIACRSRPMRDAL